MDALTTVSLALGLSADAFAVSVSSGFSIARIKLNKALKIALFFGGFQMAMPLLGWGLSVTWRSLIASFDHWLAWGLLVGIGLKTIHEALSEDDDAAPACNPTDTGTLTVLAIATSLDALAAGVGLTALQGSIFKIAGIIGVITFATCFVGVFLGRRCGHWLENRVELAGGAILIAIGFKILLEHLWAEGAIAPWF
jgi:putative Mn2+ efflux pump MntP